MSFSTLILLIAATLLLYPIVGAIGVAAAIAEGSRPKDAGFSFMPELLVFPPVFLGVASLIDYFVMPWGRWAIGSLCVTMIVYYGVASVRCLIVIRRADKAG